MMVFVFPLCFNLMIGTLEIVPSGRGCSIKVQAAFHRLGEMKKQPALYKVPLSGSTGTATDPTAFGCRHWCNA